MIATVIHVYMELVLMKLTDLLVHVLVDMKETHALLVRIKNILLSLLEKKSSFYQTLL